MHAPQVVKKSSTWNLKPEVGVDDFINIQFKVDHSFAMSKDMSKCTRKSGKNIWTGQGFKLDLRIKIQISISINCTNKSTSIINRHIGKQNYQTHTHAP